MKALGLSSVILALVLAAGFSSAASANPFAPTFECGPHNEGAVTATENMDANGNGYRYVYTCYAGNWLLTEIWYCGNNGWYYGCTIV